MMQNNKGFIYLILSGIFITNAVVAEMIGGKLIDVYGHTLSLGILPWPIVFITTDLMNEYFGPKGVRRLIFITAALIIYAFVILWLGMKIPALSFSPVDDASFHVVFGQSMWIIVGSITAFILSQLIDVYVFAQFKKRTAGKMIWLRATGSTVISQWIDTFVVAGIAFYLPGKVDFNQFINMCITGYVVKLGLAILLTPAIYLGHFIIGKYIPKFESELK